MKTSLKTSGKHRGFDLGVSFLYGPKHCTTKVEMDQQNFIKPKLFCIPKKIVKRLRITRKYEKILLNHFSLRIFCASIIECLVLDNLYAIQTYFSYRSES